MTRRLSFSLAAATSLALACASPIQHGLDERDANELVSVLTTRNVSPALPQLSVAVGASKLQASPASTVLLAAQNMTGGAVSATVNVALPLIVAVQVVVVFDAWTV